MHARTTNLWTAPSHLPGTYFAFVGFLGDTSFSSFPSFLCDAFATTYIRFSKFASARESLRLSSVREGYQAPIDKASPLHLRQHEIAQDNCAPPHELHTPLHRLPRDLYSINRQRQSDCAAHRHQRPLHWTRFVRWPIHHFQDLPGHCRTHIFKHPQHRTTLLLPRQCHLHHHLHRQPHYPPHCRAGRDVVPHRHSRI